MARLEKKAALGQATFLACGRYAVMVHDLRPDARMTRWVIRVGLALCPPWRTDDPIVLVPAMDAARLRLEMGCKSLSPREALRCLDVMDRWSAMRIRQFVAEAGLSRIPLSSLGDHDLVKLVRQAVQDGRLLAVREAGDPAKTSDSTVEQRRLVKEIEKLTRGHLSHTGRQYRLVADVDLAKTPGRNSYEVVPRDQAQRVLDGLAQQSGTLPELAALLGQARAKLTADWRPPFAAPDGLVLLRRIPVLAAAAPDVPAMTPSQIRALIEQARLEIRVVDLKDKPQRGLAFAIGTPDGGRVAGKLDQEGRGRAESSKPGTFTVTFPELDGADWDGDGAEELPPEEDRTEVSRYGVQQGDRLPTIAHDQGFARWQTIWDFAGNKALKDLRGNAQILMPGDQVAIPGKVKRKAEVPGGTATYVVQTAAERLHVRFAGVLSSEDDPVTFKATPDTGDVIEDVLSHDGWLDIDLPADTSTVKVELFRGDTAEAENDNGGDTAGSKGGDRISDSEPFASHEFTLGGLDPFDAISGIQARLFNLGFYDGAITGELDDDTHQAIAHFRWAVLRDGRPDNDAAFRSALRQAHGS